MAKIPLVVDLDGTLIQTDLLQESANAFLTGRPFEGFHLVRWLLKNGRAGLKARLAEAVRLNIASLPYNSQVLAWLSQEKEKGRKLVLATASNQYLAEQVASHLGLFAEVYGSTKALNLKGEAKRNLLDQHYGPGGYDYLGNDDADLPIFKACRTAHLVSANTVLISKVDALGNLGEVIRPLTTPAWVACLKAMRLYQWVKNLLVVLPVLAAHQFQPLGPILHALLATLVFGLTASSVYVLNDLIDVVDDRHHERKRNRPFAAGTISLVYGWLFWPVLLTLGLGLSFAFLPMAFSGVLVGYFAMTLGYSLVFKRRVLVDVFVLAGLYTLRLIAGAISSGVPLSFWLLTFSMFIFLSLAFLKRFTEIHSSPKGQSGARLRGRGYQVEDRELVSSMGLVSGYLAVLVLALYIQDNRTIVLYPNAQFIWLTCPLVLFWISRAWLQGHRRQIHDDPIIFALKDKTSRWVALGLLACIALAAIPR